MSILLASLIGAGLGLVGTGIGSAVNANQNKKNREFSAAEAQKQRDYETQMSNTAVQRQVADMEKAGINPAMAFSNGASGASTPNGANAASPISMPTGSIIANGINSAANLVASFNFDKNSKNDITPKETYKLIDSYAKIFEK